MNHRPYSILAALVALLAFVTLFFIQPATRVTILDLKGDVVYDSDHATQNHADRVEFRDALRKGTGIVTRESQTRGTELLYCAKKVGSHVIRLAIPCEGILAPIVLARWGLLAAAILGALVVYFVSFYGRRLTAAREDERFRREFTANVSHELKTPLTSIIGAAEMLEASPKDPAVTAELAGIIRKESNRLNALVRDVLALAHLEREEVEEGRDFYPVDLAELVETVASLDEVTVSHVEPITVQGDAQLLEQAVTNLVSNAKKYSGSDRIEVAVRTAAADEVPRARKGSRWAALEVRDYGVGIGAEHLPRLFERFYRVDKTRSRQLGGTGLGLAIVKHIAQLHGGQVTAQSELGRGSTFTIFLPH